MNSMTRRHLITTGVASSVGLAATHENSLTTFTDTARIPTPARKEIRAQIAIFDGFEVTDALAPYDVLHLSSNLGSLFTTTLVTVNGATEVIALDNVSVKPTDPFDSSADLLIVPGAPRLWRAGLIPEGLGPALQQWKQAHKTIVTVCTGAVLVAKTGLLKGRNVTTNHLAFDEIKKDGVNLIQARVVDDGDVITCGGVTSGIDLALYLIERYFGSHLAIATESIIEYERRGAVWHAQA